MLKKAGLVAAAIVGLSMIAPSIASADTMDDPCPVAGGASLGIGIGVNALLQSTDDALANVAAALSAGVDAGVSLTGSLLVNSCAC